MLFRSADEQAAPDVDPPAGLQDSPNGDDRITDIVTMEEELEGFRVVRAIVCSEVAAARVVARDTKSYFGILLDDNNRRPIARLWFNRTKKYLGLFDENKVETRICVSSLEDIYQHADHLRRTVARYLTSPAQVDRPPAADQHIEPDATPSSAS